MKQIAYYQSPFGTFQIEHDCTKISLIKKVDVMYEETQDCEVVLKLKNQLDSYFKGELKTFDVPIEMKGTDFQKKVWQALISIPYGTTASYKEIAIKIGNEKASRAVGLANNKNPILLIVPCHRIIGSSGKLVGYAGGLDMKKELLDLEKKNND